MTAIAHGVSRMVCRMVCLAVALAAVPAAAGECDSVAPLRPVASMFTAEAGRSTLLDTYLTPNRYGGIHLALGYTATQATGFNPERWVRRLHLGVDYAPVENPAGNSTIHSLMAEGRWSLMHRWHHVGGARNLQLMVGGLTQLRGGAVYNPSGSNNVVSARIHWSVGAAATGVWNVRWGRLPLTLSCDLALPLAGVFFSPEYDESYYEIYLGNHRHLAHFGWWGNRFDLDCSLNVDLHLGATIVRVGYRGRSERSWVNHLDTRLSTHAFVLGVGGEFLSVPRRGIHPEARIISAMY